MAQSHNNPHVAGHTPGMHDAPDEWHRHTADEERPQQAHGEIANIGVVFGAGMGAFLIVVVAVLSVYLYYTNYTIRLLDEREAKGLGDQAWAARRDATERFDRGYVWADAEQGVVLLPYSEASRRVIAEYEPRLRQERRAD